MLQELMMKYLEPLRSPPPPNAPKARLACNTPSDEGWVRVHADPPIFTCDTFLSDSECAELVAAASARRLATSAIGSSDGEDEPTRADAYRSMDFKNLPKPPPSSGKEGFTSVLDMCDELAPEPPPPDKERRDGLYFEKTNQFVPYANDFAVPHVPADASAKLGALIDRFKPK